MDAMQCMTNNKRTPPPLSTVIVGLVAAMPLPMLLLRHTAKYIHTAENPPETERIVIVTFAYGLRFRFIFFSSRSLFASVCDTKYLFVNFTDPFCELACESATHTHTQFK